MTKTLPPDPEGKNDDRARWAAAALRRFQSETGTDSEDMLGDLLCDLMHWSDRSGLGFEAALSTARMHYEAETAEEADAAGELLDALEAQADAAQGVIDAWEAGDLAGAVRCLDELLPEARAAIAKAKGGAP